MKIITLEDGFITEAVAKLSFGSDLLKNVMRASSQRINDDAVKARLDLGEIRLKQMDDAGLDMQVFSFATNQLPDAAENLKIIREGNDVGAAAVRRYSKRFASFATIPATDPIAGAAEFKRGLTELDCVGGYIQGTINGKFLDDKKYRPILEVAAEYKVPIYIHPYFPLPSLMETYFKGHEELSGPVLGFAFDAGCHFLRLLSSGAFDDFPELKIILGHLGESIPYNLERINNHLSLYAKDRKLKKTPAEYIRENLVVTTSGNFSPQSTLCALSTLGPDNVLFSVDWPDESNITAVNYLKNLPISEDEREKIAHKNAERVLNLSIR